MWWLLTFSMSNTETNNNIFRKFRYNLLEDDFSVRYMLHYLAAYFGYVRGIRWQCLCAIIMLIISCTFLKQMKAILVKPSQKTLLLWRNFSWWLHHRQPKRTICGFGLQRSFGRNILELLVYYLMPNKCKNLKDMKSSCLSICTSSL